MDITIHEKHTSVSEEIKNIAITKLEKITRFVHDAHKLEVDFIEQPAKKATQRFVCEVTVHCKRNESQAAKLKDRRVKRYHPRKRDLKTNALVNDDDLAARIFATDQVEEDAKVIKVKKLEFKPMEVGEASLQMDLLGHDFFVFQSIDSEKLNVLYRRKDGHLGIIEPS